MLTSAGFADDLDGSSIEKAIAVANISNFQDGADIFGEYKKSIDQEYNYYLPLQFGVEGVDWKVVGQRLVTKDNKIYDELQVRLRSNQPKTIYFDITEVITKYNEANKKK
jgi:hypothetical protein